MSLFQPFSTAPPTPVSSWDTFRWATVTDDDPLAIRLDGDVEALPLVPDSLVGGLVIGQRVWVQLFAKRIIVLGASAGALPSDTGWIDLTMENNWVTYSSLYGTPRYRKLLGVVYVQGLIKSGTTTVGTVLATLPAGFRPAQRLVMVTLASPGDTETRIDVDTNGEITLQYSGSATFMSLVLTPFPADA